MTYAAMLNKTCTIQEATRTQDSYGAEVLTWADKAGYVDLPCAISPNNGREVKRPDQTYVVSSHNIYLEGSVSGITELMRVVAEGRIYDILLIERDSRGMTTKLVCQIVTG